MADPQKLSLWLVARHRFRWRSAPPDQPDLFHRTVGLGWVTIYIAKPDLTPKLLGLARRLDEAVALLKSRLWSGK